MVNYVTLKEEIQDLKDQIEKTMHGSIEVRNKLDKRYLYVHFRNARKLQSKYIGEYNPELENLIYRNNILIKEIKRRLKQLEKELSRFDVNNKEISDEVKLNIDLARKYRSELIYKQSRLEGIATTFAQTETLLNHGKVNGMSFEDVQKIINLKHTWEFVTNLDVIKCQTNFSLLCQINALVEEGLSYTAGKIRSVPVHITGTDYSPSIPFESRVIEDLNDIENRMDIDSVEKAALFAGYIMKSQIFTDGNKRTAIIFANHYLISNAAGLIVVPIEKLDKFRAILIEYYEGNSDELISFFINECFQPLK